MNEEFKLDPKDEPEFREYVREYSKKGLLSKSSPEYEEVSDEELRSIIDECYRNQGAAPPKDIIRVPSPFAAINKAAKLGKTSYDWAYGSQDSNWMSFYMYHKYKKGKIKETAHLSGIERTLKLGWIISYEEVCIVADLPECMHVDDELRSHCEDGPAVQWSDGYGQYYWHGVSLNEYRIDDDSEKSNAWIIERPDLITADRINSEQNAEIKRIMIEKVGYEAYLKMTNARPIHKDELGELYAMEMNGNEDAKVVRVENSTHNGDGSVDIYWIPVPPEMKTAEEAVRWTFPNVQRYSPLVET